MHKLIIKLKLLGIGLVVLFSCQTRNSKGSYLATGIKIGEVTQSSGIVWVRSTENAVRVGNDAPMPDVKYKNPNRGGFMEVEVSNKADEPQMTIRHYNPDGVLLNEYRVEVS